MVRKLDKVYCPQKAYIWGEKAGNWELFKSNRLLPFQRIREVHQTMQPGKAALRRWQGGWEGSASTHTQRKGRGIHIVCLTGRRSVMGAEWGSARRGRQIPFLLVAEAQVLEERGMGWFSHIIFVEHLLFAGLRRIWIEWRRGKFRLQGLKKERPAGTTGPSLACEIR